jgi:hypothetical protein
LKPCKEDAVLLYKNKNPDTKLTGDILEQTAEKAKLAYPLPQKQNKIRFNRLKNHYDLIATWERKLQKMSSLKFFKGNLKKMDSAESETRYLIQKLDGDLPNFDFCRAHRRKAHILS